MKKDFLDGDHSFKNWFKIMWGNHYIHIFVVALAITIYELCVFSKVVDTVQENFMVGVAEGIMTTMGVSIPPAITIIVAYKGFYQFWNDLKNGRSR